MIRKLREDDIIPCIIHGKGYPEISVQIRKSAMRAFLENDQMERVANGRKFNLVIEGRRYLVTPRDVLLEPVSLDPKFIHWVRLCEPVEHTRRRRVPRPLRQGGPKRQFPWMDHPLLAIEPKTKPWMTEERLEERKKRRDMHIHDYLGIPR